MLTTHYLSLMLSHYYYIVIINLFYTILCTCKHKFYYLYSAGCFYFIFLFQEHGYRLPDILSSYCKLLARTAPVHPAEKSPVSD